MQSASGERLRGAGSKPRIRDLQRHSHSQPRRVVCPPHVELGASGRPSSAPGRGPTAPEAQTPGQPVLCAAGPVCAFPFLTPTGVGPFLQAMPSNSPSVLKICPRASRGEGKAACRRRCQPGQHRGLRMPPGRESCSARGPNLGRTGSRQRARDGAGAGRAVTAVDPPQAGEGGCHGLLSFFLFVFVFAFHAPAPSASPPRVFFLILT